MELGFVPGTTVTLVRRAPMGDPIELRLRGTHFSIRNSEADRIDVDPI
jgi:ferrous iron transport protein A